MDWTEVLHYDADAFSVAANRLAEGWAPSATHYFYYSGDNDGHRFHNNSQAKLKDLLMSTSLQVEWIPVPLNLCRRSISSDDIHSMQKFNPEDAQHDNIIKENEVTNVFNTYSPNIDYFSYSYKEEPEAKIIDSSTLSLLAGGNDPMLYSPPYRRTDGPPTPPPPPFPIDNRFAVPSQNKPIQPRQQQPPPQPQPTAPRGPPYKAPSPLLPPSPEPAYTAKQPQHNTTTNPNNPNLNPWSKERTQIRNNNQDLWSSNFNSGFVPKQQQQQQQPHNTWNTPYPKKGISHKVDRAHQQLAQAGELDKHKQRVAPPLPWPMAEMVITKLWSEEDAKQIWNSNYQRLWPKASPVYYFGSALHHETGVVMFTAETEVYCRVPRFEGDTVGSPMYLLGKGEATTKKEAQRKAAIDILNLLAQYKILHVAPHFQEPRGNNNEE